MAKDPDATKDLHKEPQQENPQRKTPSTMKSSRNSHHSHIKFYQNQNIAPGIVTITSNTMLNAKWEKRKRARNNPHDNANITWKILRENLGKNHVEYTQALCLKANLCFPFSFLIFT